MMREYGRRLLILAGGLMVSAVGITMMLQANVGLEPWSVLQNGMSIFFGITYGTAAMIDGLVERMEAELGHQATLIATGGMAQFIIPLCKRDIILEKDLLLKGLNILYKKNKR